MATLTFTLTSLVISSNESSMRATNASIQSNIALPLS
jgi:hypothetical protein